MFLKWVFNGNLYCCFKVLRPLNVCNWYLIFSFIKVEPKKLFQILIFNIPLNDLKHFELDNFCDIVCIHYELCNPFKKIKN